MTTLDDPNFIPPVSGAPDMPGYEHEMDPAPDYHPRYPGSGRLDDKVALITGGDSGIGRAICALFAREGAKIALVYLSEDKDAEATKTIIEQEGGEVILIKGDLGRKSFCEEVAAKTVEAFGQINILVNNAGEQNPQPSFLDIPEDQLRRTVQSNVYSMVFLSQAVLPHLSEGDAIINTNSVVSYEGLSKIHDYAITKGAVTTFTRSLSEEFAPKGIRVNAVAPGPIWTPFVTGPDFVDTPDEFGQGTPMGRCGQPNELAPAYLDLACADSSYVSGQTIHVNGGTLVSS